MILKKISQQCCLSVAGDGDLKVSALKYAEEAAEGELAAAFSVDDIKRTKAKAVLTAPRICDTDKTLLYCSYGGLWAAVAEIAHLLAAGGEIPDYRKPVAYRRLAKGVWGGVNVSIGADSRIEPFVTVGSDVVIGKDCHIESNVYIGSGTVIGDGCIIRSGAKVGVDAFLPYEDNGKLKCFFGAGRAVLKNEVQIGCGAVIQRGSLSDTVLEDRVLIGPLAVIGHDVKIGRDTRIVSQSGIAGRAELGAYVKVFGQSGVSEGVRMEDGSTLMARSGATKNIERGKTVSGSCGREHKEELRIQALLRKLRRE